MCYVNIVRCALLRRGPTTGVLETLLVKRTEQATHNPGLWEFPGGKPEPGESCLVAIIRELEEEIGVTVEPKIIVKNHGYANVDGTRREAQQWLYYAARGIVGTPSPNLIEVTECRWFPLSAITTTQFTDLTLQFVRLVEQQLANTSLAANAA